MGVPNSTRQHFPPDGRLPGLGLALVAVLFMVISPLALVLLGLNYDDAGGGPLEKVHPATVLAFAVLGLSALYVRNPLTATLNALLAYPGTLIFLITVGLLIVHSIRVVGLPFTFFFDTFLAPVVVFFLFKDMRQERADRFVLLFHTLMMVNATIGIIEFAVGVRLTPLVANGIVIEDDWRSTALLGHPLANASITGAYILTLALGAARDLPRPFAIGGFVIASAGMVVFGGRASSVLLLVMLMGLAASRAGAILRGARFDRRTLIAALIAIPLVSLAIITLAEAGFFDLFIERFLDDRGSASTRIEMFELFKHIPLNELLLAPDPEQLATLRTLYGLDFGIESFWVSFVLSYGLVPGLAFFAGLFLFCRDIVRATRPGTIWVLVFFFLVASTSVSLSAKTPLFAILVLMLLVLMRQPQPEDVLHDQSRSPLRLRRRHRIVPQSPLTTA
ncbi:MAG: VpsF family polysaccharide biosynthesis protein [Hyphomicrobiaceae bacterium]|nr:VpsF family polysaccharide biosynthesis protein [Hyphomicrobiaceae bacterium]